jgi:signal transduction histidine kinase
LLALGSGVTWALAGHDSAARARRYDTAAAATVSALDTRAGRVTGALAGPVEALSLLPPGQVLAQLRVDRDVRGSARVVDGSLPRDLTAAQITSAARVALEVAADTAQPQAAPVLGDLVPFVAAEYSDPTAADSTTGTQERRAKVVGWRIALVSPRALLSGLPTATGLTGKASDAGIAVAGKRLGVPKGATEAATTIVAGQPWTVLSVKPGGLSVGAATTLGMTLLGAAVLLLLDLRSQRALQRQRAAAAALERETKTVATLGPLLQSSLDLAEVLPAVAVRLSDEFALSRFAVQLLGEHGELQDVFALGSRGRSDETPIDLGRTTVTELPADTPGCLPLMRAGRTIGRLTLVGRRELGQAQLAALSAASDLIAVASYNVELYEREQASVQRLRELDQLKDAFLSTISHELRTPLTAISGFVRLLRDRWGQLRDDQRLEFLERVHGNTLSLGLLVDDLLDFARLERQALNAPPSALQLDQHVATTLGQLEPVLGDHEVRVELQPVRAMANAAALERVLANLLTNAAKFSPPDSPILVRVRLDGATALLEVVDEGAGIAPAERERVFTRFYRGESDAARGTRGAGIGLSVVRELVSQMGGTVHAEGNEPAGTRMVVALQVAEPSPDRPVSPTPATVQRSRI